MPEHRDCYMIIWKTSFAQQKYSKRRLTLMKRSVMRAMVQIFRHVTLMALPYEINTNNTFNTHLAQ